MRAIKGLALVAAMVAAQAPAADRTMSTPAYEMGPNDQIELSIFGQTDKIIRTRIKPDGTITLPYIGTVPAFGLTTSQLAAAVAKQLKSAGIYQNPIVNVELLDYVSRVVTVLGQVGTPGIYPLDRPMTLASILARAGGVRGTGGSDQITLRRGGQVIRVPIAVLAQDAGRDMVLIPGDVVYVADADRFYIYGQVNAPGAYEIAPGMTLRQALARGGGPTLAGTEKRVTLFRGGKEAKNMLLDEVMRPGDILTVGEKTF